jgi:hypothetical protein
MNEQVLVRGTNRREMLRLSAMGALGGVVAGAMGSRKAQAAETLPLISYASWIHGHSMQIEYPDRLAEQHPMGFHMHVEGKPGTVNWFHFAIPTPVIINDVRLRADAVIVNFETGSADAIVRDVHIYDGDVGVVEHNGVNLTGQNWFYRFEIPTRPEMWQGIGVSIGVAFGIEAMAHWMDFASAGCDFTLQPPLESAVSPA